MSELRGGKIIPWLIKALDDPEPAVRQCAGLALGRNPDPSAVPRLIQMLRDPNPLTARLAGEALAAIGSPAVDPLLEVLKCGSPAERIHAIRALAEVRDPRAVPAFFEALDDSSTLIGYWANEGLERLGVGMTFYNP